MKCIVTGQAADEHHLLSRKAYPELIDKRWNKIPISRELHTEWHLKGASYMADKYFQIKVWMVNNGWSYCQTKAKWTPQSYT